MRVAYSDSGADDIRNGNVSLSQRGWQSHVSANADVLSANLIKLNHLQTALALEQWNLNF